MLFFSAVVKVLDNCNEQRSINGYKFDVYRVQAGLIEIYALFDVGFEAKKGDIVKSPQVYLTNYDRPHRPVELALRFVRATVLQDKSEYKDNEPLVVRANGLCKKPKKDVLNYVGVERRPFLASTLCIKNEEGQAFDVLLTAFDKRAESLLSLKQAEFIDCKAKLLRKDGKDVFKLVLVDYSVC